jgi:hypothetical protein
LTAASATFALKAGVWFRRARLVIVSPDSRDNLARRQAETPLIALFKFAEPALYKLSPKVVKGASIAITMAAVLLSLSARRENDLRRDQDATVQQSN